MCLLTAIKYYIGYIIPLTPEDYKIIIQVMAEVKDEVVESDRLQNEVLQGEATLNNIF